MRIDVIGVSSVVGYNMNTIAKFLQYYYRSNVNYHSLELVFIGHVVVS